MRFIVSAFFALVLFSCQSDESRLAEMEAIMESIESANNADDELVLESYEEEAVVEEWEEPFPQEHGPINVSHFADPNIDECYWSDRLMNMMIKDTTYDEFAMFQSLSNEQFSGLTEEEKFIYCIKFPESFDQICAEPMPREEGKLYRYLPWDLSGYTQSESQYEYLYSNKDQSIDFILNCAKANGSVSISYLTMLDRMKAYRAIPALMDLFDSKPDPDILVLFVGMMRAEEFEPFMASDVNYQLYDAPIEEPENEMEYGYYEPSILLTEDVKMTILDHAMAFYADQNPN